MKSIKIASCIALAVSITPIQAEEAEKSKAPGSGPNPYVDCGIGAALFPNTHWAAVTSNTIWDAGSTALTSATASPETCNSKNVQAATFILDTYDTLVEETAKGNGEHVVALLNIMEVPENEREQLISNIRSSMGEEVTNPGYQSLTRIEKSNVYYQLLSSAVNHS
ncbi:DUF3015 family protein [bacterium SCSIO 12696]|nr:DUF3015 family protein [bacterium SCSIO 12696]